MSELAGKTLLVTGAGGFIGARMMERARTLGMKVRGLERSAEAARKVGAEVGDVCDPESARRACDGADIVFHTAAIVEEDGDLAEFRRVNVGGTVNMAEAARGARFVHLSSVMVYGFQFPPWVREDGPLRGEGNAYCQTKIEGEEALRRFDNVIVIRPGDVYGPASIPWVVRPVDMMKKGLVALIDGGRGILNHVYVDNLLDGIFAALQHEAVGQTFNLTDGVATTCFEYFNRLARAAGLPPLRSVPSWLARPAFRAVERSFRLLGKKPPVQSAAIDYLLRPNAYSNEKARTQLGWSPRVSLDAGMMAVEKWLGEQ